MATLNLRRFAHPGTLKSIARGRLLTLLSPYASFLNSRGFRLPEQDGSENVDYEALAGILASPDTDTPAEMADALFFIHEMATPEGMDSLLTAAHDTGLALVDGQEHTPTDIAVQVYLLDRDMIERKHAEQFLARPRSFEYYQTDVSPVPPFRTPNAATLRAIQEDLDDWFETKKRGRGSRVFVYPKSDGVWFLVRHGDPFRREGAIDGDKSSCVLYRQEKFDVLVYDTRIGEMRMNARSKGEKELYRVQFGKHLFGSEEFFPGCAKYSLEPLRTHGADSIECIDVDGMEWARLREIQFYWGGSHSEIEIRKADDIFAALEDRGRSLPERARIIRASFQVKFTDSNSPRTVTIKPSNVAQYTRDGDSVVVEEWLAKRGFIGS